MAPYHRPENTLKRAEELIAVGQSAAALELLYETISSKRTRSLSPAALDPIAIRFVELAVELRKGKTVKDGLHQYKKNVQATSVGSIEVIIKKFIDLSELKVHEAKAEADQATTIDADEDLEAETTPEDLLLATISGDQNKDRSDRELVTPWLKFLWEAYRTSLDILRNSSRLEIIYKTVVEQAFTFCRENTRKTEFRRLCEVLRNHLQSSNKTGQLNAIDVNDPETMQRFLDIRFAQLEVAAELELWQEAFRSVEDVHNLLVSSKRSPKPQMMTRYYEHLAQIFSVGGNSLFHAAALAKYYNLASQNPSIDAAERTRMASLVVTSVLSIPTLTQQQSKTALIEVDEQKNKNTRLTSLLNLSKTPTRDSLLKSILGKNVLAHVKPEVKELYKILEVDFHPLTLSKKLSPVIAAVASEPKFSAYIKPLYQVILTRLFQQLSQVYEAVKLEFVLKLATLPAPFNASHIEIENFIIKSCKRGQLSVQLDHDNASITFKNDLFNKPKTTSAESTSSLQATPSEIVRSQLSRLGKVLFATVSQVDRVFIEEQAANKKASIERAIAGIEEERAAVAARYEFIEKRKEEAALAKVQRESEEQRKRLQKLHDEQLAEKIRIEEDKRKRELLRIQKEQDAIRDQEKKKIAEEINAKGIIKIDVDNLEDMDTNRLRTMQVEQLEKESKDKSERLRITGRRLDHIERALRREEVPLVEADYEIQKVSDAERYNFRTKALIESSKREFAERKLLVSRFQRITPFYQDFYAEIAGKRKELFDTKRKEAIAKLERAKEERIAQVIADHDRKLAETARREAEERQAAAREAEAHQAAERAEKEKVERLQKEKREREETNKQRDEILKRQLEREAEIEAKLAARRAGGSSAPSSSPGSSNGGYVPPSRRTGGYVPPSRRVGGEGPPPRRFGGEAPSSSPSSTTAPSTGGKYVPGALRRARENAN
ncbi:hypothetical protein NADFUDRAFT_82631 [Nadsonia fulvescens var. elongata DSM 6958]|uniref:Eukaryotic translation initiation factor 3 subunit A n=1 Tax=Nadsonia fulvescens var. elongata DSM 6958 TaxID=857566 RepID=A0A1E3PJI0_9ASCO|nr:hypothetical protein NADFUDRAFT_82631 [Nadsonia fulvescens var. elongata DSM 6958]